MSDWSSLVQILTFKLELLHGQREKVQQAVEIYFNEVTGPAQAWIQGREEDSSQQHFQDVSLRIDKAMVFLAGRAAEINKGLDAKSVKSGESSASPSSSTPSTQDLAPTCSNQQFLSLQERVEKLEKKRMTAVAEVKKELDKLKEKVDTVAEVKSQTEGKVTSLKLGLDELSGKFTSSVQEYTLNKNKDNGRMKKLEDRIDKAENKSRDVSNALQKVGQSVSTEEGRVTEIGKNMHNIEKRLSSLERKQEGEVNKSRSLEEKIQQTHDSTSVKLDSMNERVKYIEDERMTYSKKMEEAADRIRTLEDVELHEMKSDVKTCQSRLDTLEKRQRPVVGFAAHNPVGICPRLVRHSVVTCFTRIICNEGRHYNPRFGVFTAPVGGIYMACLTHLQWKGDSVDLQIMHKKVYDKSENAMAICKTLSFMDCANCTDVTLVRLCKGDSLYVKAASDGRLGSPSGFSCVLIG